jgi:putative methyltransferase
MWAVLKSYWERHGSDRDAFTWLDPLYKRDTVNRMEEFYSEPIAVLGLSCYTWNFDLNCEVARWVKERNPGCVVVAGGPDPDYKDPDFFRKHPYIDMIVVKDGEIPFMKILETVLEGKRDFSHIPGLYLPSPTQALRIVGDNSIVHQFTGNTEVPDVFDYSPYIDQAPFYERAMAQHDRGWIMATWETNRGCPYSCSYCDWGSSTMSKVRKFEMNRVEAEVDFLCRIGVDHLFLVDANFGILARDVEITDHLTATKAKYGFPKKLYYSSAKNNPDRTVEIVKRLYGAGLLIEHGLSVQHTDLEVLKATDRSNIGAAKYREVVGLLGEAGIPCEVQLILGIPGDTLEKWKTCLAEVMEWGVHENYQISPYALLPNAPAADPAFRQKWKIDTLTRALIPYGGIRVKDSMLGVTESNIIVSSLHFSREDWLEAQTYTSFVKAYHNSALTRMPAMYLWFVHGVPYREFYDALIDDFTRQSAQFGKLYTRVREVYAHFLNTREATDEMELEDFPACPFVVDPPKWAFVKTILQLDTFYRELSAFLRARYPNIKNLQSVIDYQRNLVATPDYSYKVGKSFPVNRDWPAFFDAARKLTDFRKLEEPEAFWLPRIAEIAEEDRVGSTSQASLNRRLDFGDGNMDERWMRWLDKVVMRPNSAEFTNLPHPQLRKGLRFPGQRAAGAVKVGAR